MPFNANMTDPIQGFDVDVTVFSYNSSSGASQQVLVGRFTSILVRVVNVTETYLELNQRMPRHLDGEINIVWQMERGMLNTGVLEETFGFFSGDQIGRNEVSRIKRAARFSIDFRVQTGQEDFVDQQMKSWNGQIKYLNEKSGNAKKTYRLHLCKTDTMSFGATSGRNIVANQWQGTAEGIELMNS
jgi:hypothetical protein